MNLKIMQFWIAEVTLHGIGIYTSSTAPSPEGEGWDEGKCKHLILFSSPRPSPAGEGAQYVNIRPTRWPHQSTYRINKKNCGTHKTKSCINVDHGKHEPIIKQRNAST